MIKWVAERGTNDPDVWRDEDVAMATRRHLFRDQDDARTMLVGIIMAEAFGFFAMNGNRERLEELTKYAEDIAECRTDQVEQSWNQVFYRLRKLH